MLIAACGLICSDCEAYKATQAGDAAEIANVAQKWSQQYNADIKPESVWCDGCLTDGSRKCGHCAECEIRTCVVGREIENCASCSDYPCEMASNFFKMVPDAKKTLDSLRKG